MSDTAPPDRLTPIDDSTGRTIYFHERRGTYHTWCDEREYDPASTALLLAVSSVRNVEPDELEPLSARIDPDALDAFVSHDGAAAGGSSDATVTFSYAGCAITIRADGEVVIEPDPQSVA
ncbi:HalOD1 output domain-containing protein [Natrarchaeobaculum sulfurireducens]|uniref:Halobacterial output domain-containing protein n=1 Tax=Natrarchaeobaculum sulfurireducens TaxID=2044521 RepID=A0A346PN32_9EURY|nr:HalOD1 output domain-containing protein [Natrarchaeobaculum sulfurireducens]AXR79129.1 hypothetical protein AArc1_2817 [Natrarchaeobaculum sulfurireducens]AXR80927.1 hypothetical protein AArcMg_0906 [Natrarchaeobaculum sulfurireducens]